MGKLIPQTIKLAQVDVTLIDYLCHIKLNYTEKALIA